MRKFTLVAVALTALAASFFFGVTSASAAKGPPYFCLYNATASCADVMNDSYTLGQPIWIYNYSQGKANQFSNVLAGTVCDSNDCSALPGDGGITSPWPFTAGSGFNTEYNHDSVWVLDGGYESGSTDWCLGEESGAAQLRQYDTDAIHDEGGSGCFWVSTSGNQFINVQRTDAQNEPEALSAAGTSNTSAMSTQTVGLSGYWQRWIL
jgi:hypothetical protein